MQTTVSHSVQYTGTGTVTKVKQEGSSHAFLKETLTRTKVVQINISGDALGLVPLLFLKQFLIFRLKATLFNCIVL
jgi:hypothetical protein